MNKKTILALTACLSIVAAIGCGVSDPSTDSGNNGNGSTTDGNNGTTGTSTATDGGSTGTTGTSTTPDAGTGGTTTTPDAGTGGTTTSPDAGTTTPTPDAGGTTTTPDAGSPAADGGSTPCPDAGSPATDAGSTPTGNPAPLSAYGACDLRFADQYVGATECAEVRGSLPGMTWSSGPAIEDADHDHLYEFAMSRTPAGDYELSYLSRACPGGSPVTTTWADYGSRTVLLGMTADARSFINCNWWDSASGTTISVGSPSCDLRIHVDGSCNVTGAGNMRNYH